jgi:hypothetical protein
MSDIVWHPVGETPPKPNYYAVLGTLEWRGLRVDWGQLYFDGETWRVSEMAGLCVTGVTHWTHRPPMKIWDIMEAARALIVLDRELGDNELLSVRETGAAGDIMAASQCLALLRDAVNAWEEV